jgi:hypothetical protein
VVRRNPGLIVTPIWLNDKIGGLDCIIPLARITAKSGYSATTAVKNSRLLHYDSALLKHEGPGCRDRVVSFIEQGRANELLLSG